MNIQAGRNGLLLRFEGSSGGSVRVVGGSLLLLCESGTEKPSRRGRFIPVPKNNK